MSPSKHLWLRAESKPFEHRSALTPVTAKALLDAGFQITVEKSTQRCFLDEEFSCIGCTLAQEFSWPQAPADAYILALKELPENENFPLHHTHIYFAHCFKYQPDWKKVLERFRQGNGTLLDLEFLQNEQGKRVASFGHMAGFVGCAIALDVWCHNNLKYSASVDYPALKPFANEQQLINSVKSKLEAVAELDGGKCPSIMVVGALGKCGGGACDLAEKVGIADKNIVKWDRQETQQAGNGPYECILGVDIFINCVYLNPQDTSSPRFLTPQLLDSGAGVLSVICDVSCDVGSAKHPLPVYNSNTTFDKPTVKVQTSDGGCVHVVSIDHLPSLLPKESSQRFSADLLPTLLELKQREKARVWTDAEQIFRQKLNELP